MIYEIFKTSFTIGGGSWFAYAFAILASAYSIYITGLLLSWLWSFSYSFIYEGKKTTPNWLATKVISLIPRVDRGELHGIYLSREIEADTYWKYREYTHGVETGHADNLSRFGRNATLTPLTSYKTKMAGYGMFRGWDEANILIFAPLLAVVMFLFADTLPTIAACLGVYYGVLLTARKAIKVGTAITEHINNKEVHTKE